MWDALPEEEKELRINRLKEVRGSK
jgi:hypothetical protein